jgi:hypothetical protein
MSTLTCKTYLFIVLVYCSKNLALFIVTLLCFRREMYRLIHCFYIRLISLDVPSKICMVSNFTFTDLRTVLHTTCTAIFSISLPTTYHVAMLNGTFVILIKPESNDFFFARLQYYYFTLYSKS